MTAMLFCEGSGRDKQIAQESSGHKDGRTGAGMPCRWTTEALQIIHLYIWCTSKIQSQQNPDRLMQPYAEKAKMAKNGLEKVK